MAKYLTRRSGTINSRSKPWLAVTIRRVVPSNLENIALYIKTSSRKEGTYASLVDGCHFFCFLKAKIHYDHLNK